MSALDDCLDRLARSLEDFIKLLEQEARALSGGDSESLAPIVDQRNLYSVRLAEHWQTLAGLLNIPVNAGLVAFRERAYPDLRPPPAWHRLETLAREAEHRNKVNGQLLEEQMRRTQAAMQVLRNVAASQSLYGADGRVTDFMTTQRKIDSA